MSSSEPKCLVAAISGGVDSSVAAAIYKERGCEVIGVTLRLKDCDQSNEKRKACCGIDDDLQARAAADLLGIPHYFLDYREDFRKEVLCYAWDEYSHARTPNPCALCNAKLKFGRLLQYAKDVGADGIITGHHSRIVRCDDGTVALCRGNDPDKDQTYFLFALTQEQLSHSYFPVGEITKPEVREYARKIGLANAEKVESQDACFGIAGEAFAETLRSVFDAPIQQGYFIGPGGSRLSPHQGIHLYTIGQRKGLGIALGKPAYVSRIDYETGDVYLATDQAELMAATMRVGKLNWQQESFAEKSEFDCQVQIRYRHKPVAATVVRRSDDLVEVTFTKAQRAVTPGQAAVFYDGDTVIGGGWIE